MAEPKLFGGSERCSSRMHHRSLLNLHTLCVPSILICLQAIEQLIAEEAAITRASRSVVLIDSAVAFSIPKSELVGSQIKSYFFEKTKIDFLLR
jgi:hypothetical protein